MSLSKNQIMFIAGFGIIAVLVIGTLAFVPGEFGGSDGSGGDVAEGDYGYEPWTGDLFSIITGDPDYELPGEIESMLFAVQAAIGALIIGFFAGIIYAGKKAEKAKNAEAQASE